jgi:hypothetical protein
MLIRRIRNEKYVKMDPEYSVPEKLFIHPPETDKRPKGGLDYCKSGTFCSGTPLKTWTIIP